MTSTNLQPAADDGPQHEPELYEHAVLVAREDEDRAAAALIDVSPGGFRSSAWTGPLDEETESVEFAAYLPHDDPATLPNALAADGVACSPATVTRVDPGWEERWKEFHRLVIVAGMWIGPPWCLAEAPDGMPHVVIDPGQGFGTGAHPTTQLMVELLAAQPRHLSLVDVGTGSGVLAIAASKLGFRSISALDNDPAAVDSAADNFARNGTSHIDVRCADVLQGATLPTAELMLANIILGPLVALADRIALANGELDGPEWQPPARIIVSGLLRSQTDEAVAAFERAGYTLREHRERGGWIGAVLEHRSDRVADILAPPVL